MAEHGVWGIDIGQSALKALRCVLADDGTTVVADSFDFIEYPKILTQPEAEPEELIRDALTQFLERNEVKGDKVAISVSGQSGLARFIKLPPVDSKKIPDIVKYEAKQQIPFELDDVIWDYEELPGGSEEDGFALESEVGLFAMKRDKVYEAMQPFDDAGIELDIIQLTPLSIYNSVCHDLLQKQMADTEFDPDDPPESCVVLSLGTDTTDLVVTNGFRVWQRNIPVGGNQFTKQLTQELKLTFAKAEHLKKNARQAEDPKTIFQAMRPVFNDLVTEIQRSIGFFQSIDRQAKIGKIVALGNAMKLPGLKEYLAKNLNLEVVRPESFSQLAGPGVVNSPAFKENILSFSVCYGLCVQGLGKAKLSTSLLPQEILTHRMIRDKKPWAVGAVAILILGICFHFFFVARAANSVHKSKYDPSYSAVGLTDQKKQEFKTKNDELVAASDHLQGVGLAVVGDAERRLLLPEALTAVNACLPAVDPITEKSPPLGERDTIYIEAVETKYYENLEIWYQGLQEEFMKKGESAEPDEGSTAAAPPATPPAAPPATPGADPAAGGAATAGPTGEGWVFQLTGYHDYDVVGQQGAAHLRNTLLKKLMKGTIKLPAGPGGELTTTTMDELGIRFPVIADDTLLTVESIPNPEYDRRSQLRDQEIEGDEANGEKKDEIPELFYIDRYRFWVQFCWTPTPASQRLLERERLKQQKEAAESLAADGE